MKDAGYRILYAWYLISSFQNIIMKRFLKNITLSFLSLIIFFAFAEILTRLFWDENISITHKGIIFEGNNRSIELEEITYNTNSFGIRNKEIPNEKPSKTIRILALGDSFIWGDGLPEKELITVKLEKLLTQHFNQNVEIINAGICGFNTKDELQQLQRLHPVYKPDAVMQFFFTNDLLTTDSLNKITSWRTNTITWLNQNVKFYSFLYYLIKSTINAEIATPDFMLPSDYFNLDDTKPGWVDFKKYTLEIKQFCDDKKMNYCFVLIPTLTNLDSNYPYKELNKKVAAYIDSLGAPFLSYFSLFSKHKPTDLWVSKENTHWNGFATSLAANELTNFILSNKFLDNKIK